MNFIKEITVKNFFSIKNKVTVKFEASEYTIKHHPYRVFELNDSYTNKLSAFYGANASGKTTFLKALVVFAHVISNKNSEFFPISYKNIYNAKNVSSFIEVIFIFNNQEYIYKIDFLSDNENINIGIKNETLKIKRQGINKTLLNRKKETFKDLEGNSIENILFDKVSNKQSLLVESITRVNDYEGIVDFFGALTFTTNIRGISSVSMQVEKKDDLLFALLFSKIDKKIVTTEDIEDINQKAFYNFLFRFLQNINLDISGAESEIDIEELKEKEINIDVSIDIIHNINTKKKLNFNLESSGTKMLFKILFDLFYAYKKQSILVLDELDSILHPMLVPIINLIAIKNDIQLIYTTHNIYNMKYLYSDEIFLIEKSKEHDTSIVNLKDNYRGYENFEKLYRNKQLGGIPKLENINLDMLVIDK